MVSIWSSQIYLHHGPDCLDWTQHWFLMTSSPHQSDQARLTMSSAKFKFDSSSILEAGWPTSTHPHHWEVHMDGSLLIHLAILSSVIAFSGGTDPAHPSEQRSSRKSSSRFLRGARGKINNEWKRWTLATFLLHRYPNFYCHMHKSFNLFIVSNGKIQI